MIWLVLAAAAVRFAGAVTLGVTPVPLSVTLCGLPAALWEMLMFADRLPLALGVNVALIVHVAFTASEVPHVLVNEKSLAFAPHGTMLEIVKGAVPEFLMVTDCGALLEPIS